MCGHSVLVVHTQAASCTGFVNKGLRVIRTCFAHRLVILVVFLAFLRGVIYATVLPPWDYNDEEQHFHYVQFLFEERKLPLMGSTYLSSDILTSVSETLRWEHFHLQRPEVVDARQMGLEGYSYEAYQPPMYYALLIPPYGLLQAVAHHGGNFTSGRADALTLLYGLRLFTVLLSTFSIVFAYLLFRKVFTPRPELAVAAAVLLAFIPERTMAMSRVNNDALLEVLSTLTLLVLVRSIGRPFTAKRSLVLGAVLGLAVLAKLSAVVLIPLVLSVILWQAILMRSPRHLIWNGCAVLGSIIVITGWFFARNLWLYGDFTAIASFTKLANFESRYTLSSMLVELYQRLWVTRWEGAGPELVALTMAFACLLSLAGLVYRLVKVGSREGDQGEPAVVHIVLLMAAALLWLVPLWIGTRTGIIQHIEGRFVAPAYVPIIALLLLGFSFLFARQLCWAVAASLVAILAITDTVYIIGFSLPYYYSIQAFDANRFFAQKPNFVNATFVGAIGICYLAVTVVLFFELVRCRSQEGQSSARGRRLLGKKAV